MAEDPHIKNSVNYPSSTSADIRQVEQDDDEEE
jgi:hypothetical protein